METDMTDSNLRDLTAQQNNVYDNCRHIFPEIRGQGKHCFKSSHAEIGNSFSIHWLQPKPRPEAPVEQFRSSGAS